MPRDVDATGPAHRRVRIEPRKPAAQVGPIGIDELEHGLRVVRRDGADPRVGSDSEVRTFMQLLTLDAAERLSYERSVDAQIADRN